MVGQYRTRRFLARILRNYVGNYHSQPIEKKHVVSNAAARQRHRREVGKREEVMRGVRLEDWKKTVSTSLVGEGEIDVIFCHSYCMAADGLRLTPMSQGCVERTIRIAKERNIPLVVFSNAYETWAEESRHKDEMVRQAGLDAGRVRHIPSITNTYDEIRKLKDLLSPKRDVRIAMVADEDHIPRILYAMRLFWPDAKVIPVPVRCARFERSLEPSLVKSIRLGHRSLWVLWNILGYVLLAITNRPTFASWD